ncbi:hypothetical protein ES703_33893 [subsurface metagenome]
MKIRLALIVVPLLTLAVALSGGFTLLWRFFIFLVVVLVLSHLWSRLSIRSIDGHVEKPSSLCQVGEYFEEGFTVINRSKILTPLIEAQEDTDLPGYQNTVAISLSSRSSHTWHTKVYCRRRGRYSIGALTVKATDPLGFFPVERNIGKRQEIIIYPATLELPFFQALPQQEPGVGPRRWLASEAGPNASHVREYVSGDSLRHIHWHTTAHTGKLMVREFDPDRSNYATFKEIWIVLDMHRTSQLGEGDETTEEYGVTIAASLVKKYLDSGKRVGLITAGDRSYLLSPETGDGYLQYLLRSLALLKATGEVSIDNLLASRAEHFNAGSTVIIIMPSVNPGIAAPMRQVINRHVTVTAILLDSFSFGGGISPANNARGLSSSGFNVYVVRGGMEIALALDSRLPSSRMQYVGGKV